MATKMLSIQISELRDALAVIEAQLQSGESTREALEDFKVAVDTVRTSIIAILGASRSEDYQQSIAQFHLKRAMELSRNVMSDVVLGTITAESDGWAEFHQRANHTLERLDLQTGDAIGRLN